MRISSVKDSNYKRVIEHIAKYRFFNISWGWFSEAGVNILTNNKKFAISEWIKIKNEF